MGKTLLLTGYPGCGKTTIIKKVIAQLGDRAGGFYTEEIFGPGGRKGFELITLDGRRFTLAHKDLRAPKMPQVGRYGVDVDILNRVGIPALQRAAQAGQIVIVDEIGAMELLSRDFQSAVLQLILGPALVLGSIIYKPHAHADLYKTLAQVALWEVEQRTRDALPAKVLAWLENPR